MLLRTTLIHASPILTGGAVYVTKVLCISYSCILLLFYRVQAFARLVRHDVTRGFLSPYGVYISQLIRFARVCNHVTDFNAQNKCLTAKLLQQVNRYHKLRKTFSKFYRRHYELISKYNVGLKTLSSEGLSEPEFYGDLVYKFKKTYRN